MRIVTKFCCLAALTICCAAPSAAEAQKWAKDMFAKTSHDFGTLARGAKADFAFTFENLYLEDVRIAKVQTSCGCAGVKYPTEEIKTYEKKQVVVTIDTRSFLGRKDATLTVKFDKPFPAEVPLHVHCYIRSDVVFEPGAVRFGTVPQGKGAQRTISVSYAGRDDWRITSVRSPLPYLTAEPTETRRGLGRVGYELSVALKPDAPPGYLSEQLIIETNDTNPQKSKVPLTVDGVVAAEVTVRPAQLPFLAVCGGKTMERKVVVQGIRPFRVTEITCDDPRVQVRVPDGLQKVHVIPVRFSPGETAGQIDTQLHIRTDLNQRVLNVGIHAEVAGATEGS